MKKIALLLLVLALVTGWQTANAEPGSGLVLLTDNGESEPALSLDTRVTMTVTGMLVRVQVRQTFRNTGTGWREGIYRFPLPDDAAVDQLELQIGDRRVIGEIQEKQQARATYRKARDSGRKASLISQQRANLFATHVANIGPGETVSVTIGYQHMASFRDGEFSLHFPMTIMPRYQPARPVSALEAADLRAQTGDPLPRAWHDNPRSNVAIRVDLQPGFTLAELKSPYHPVTVDDRGDHAYISLAEGEVPGDRDFVLRWRPYPEQAPVSSLFAETRDGEDYHLLMLLPPHYDYLDEVRQPRELILVIDVSGSMAGPSIEQARLALLQALADLGPGDSFNIFAFNNEVSALSDSALPASPDNLARARAFTGALQAGGGTEIAAAVNAALTDTASDRIRQVLFLTDGSVSNEQEVFAGIRKQLGDSRLFTVGIGAAPNRYFMSRAARFGRGTYTAIGDNREVAERMSRLLAKLRYPVLTDLELQVSGGELDIWPRQIPDLYLGEPLLLAYKAGAGSGRLLVSGKAGQAGWAVSLPAPAKGRDTGIARYYARQKIAALMDSRVEGRDPARIREQVLPLALRHGLVSAYTSLVAVDRNPSRSPGEPLQSARLSNALPAGAVTQKVFGYPSTATDADLRLVFGATLVLLALMFLALRKTGLARPC